MKYTICPVLFISMVLFLTVGCGDGDNPVGIEAQTVEAGQATDMGQIVLNKIASRNVADAPFAPAPGDEEEVVMLRIEGMT
ncbi:MAG: hypothetical protein ACE5PV_01175 [Candidatus Poribacteria bacterium]